MKTPLRTTALLAAIAGAGLVADLTAQVTPVTAVTSVTYQGRLNDGPGPANGVYDFNFSIYNANGIFQIAGPLSKTAVPVNNGLFTVQLEFDPAVWLSPGNNARLLEVAVRNAGSEGFTTLSPRHPITAAPFALHTLGVSGFALNAADGSPSNALFVDNDGDVGIGTVSPLAPLHVRGNNSHLTLEDAGRGNSWNIYTENHPSQSVSGNLLFVPGPGGVFGFIQKSTGVYFSGSDARLKTDIVPLGAVLDRVLRLRPVSYRFKSAPASAPPALGFIAQEVEPLFPEVVDERDGVKALAYSEFVPVTISALQELNRKHEERANHLEQELQRRSKESTELKRSVEELKTLVHALAQQVKGGAQ